MLVDVDRKGIENNDSYNNMGACNTCFIHWLSFSVEESMSINKIVNEIIRCDSSEFIEVYDYKKGYTKSYKHNSLEIYVYTNLINKTIGSFVEIRGSACEIIQDDMYRVCSEVIKNYGRFSRIDIAFDDYKGLLDLEKIYEASRNGSWSGKFKKTRQIEQHNSKGETFGKTVCFGSRKSDTYLRIYDKGKQQKTDVHWIRCEFEIKNEKANNAIALYLNCCDLGKVYFGLLKNYLMFKIPSSDSNKSRWKIEPWWEDFLGDAEKVKIGSPRKDKAVSSTSDWLRNQCSLAIYESYQEGGVEFILELLAIGASKHERKTQKNASRGIGRDS